MPIGFAKSIFSTSAAGAAGMGTPEAVTFDGTNDYTTCSSFSITDGKQGTVSIWYYTTASATNQEIMTNSSNNTILGTFYVQLQTTQLIIQGRNSARTDIFTMTNTLGDVANQWNHILCSWDLAAGTRHMYLNDSTTGNDVSTYSNDTIDYDTAYGSGEWTIGAGVDQTIGTYFKFQGDIGPVYFTDEYIDITQAANRRKFSNTDGTPADMGADGSIPTGTAAKIFMNGNATYWNAGTNGGTGGSFSMAGSVTDSSNEPVDAF